MFLNQLLCLSISIYDIGSSLVYITSYRQTHSQTQCLCDEIYRIRIAQVAWSDQSAKHVRNVRILFIHCPATIWNVYIQYTYDVCTSISVCAQSHNVNEYTEYTAIYTLILSKDERWYHPTMSRRATCEIPRQCKR